MGWTLRYASHLGYRSPDAPLFRESVGTLDPLDHIAYAADLGLAGVQDAWAVSRSREQQNAIGDALARRGLEAGCLVATPRERIRERFWGRSGPEIRAEVTAVIEAGIATAKRLGTRWLAVIGGADPGVPHSTRLAAFAENLRWAADLAAAADVVLCLEAISRKSLPDMLLHHVADADAVVRAVDSPNVRLIFDTAHVQAMDGDLLANLDAVWDRVGLVQLADNPGRLEPESGEINFRNILIALEARGYRGLVELEHGWSEPTRDCEQRGLDRLRRMDAQL